jgi:TPP-dependent pyruvate/acetoin dehydrogenase alpha subunit
VTAQSDDRLAMYRMMLLIRRFEEQVFALAQGGLTAGLVHLAAGQEATNVGACLQLRADDFIASHHRGHGHCLAKGADPGALMAEILGRKTGLCGGRSGSMHIFDPAHGNLGTNGIVGGGIPLAAGAALTARHRGAGQVAIAFFGDGALNQGLLHECMNMAAIWRLPAIFLCENNGFGEYTALEDVTAGSNLTDRGAAFGIPSSSIDGMDVLAVHAAVAEAVRRARAGDGPAFIICNTYRYGGHHSGDKQAYKDPDEARLWRERDPILRLSRHLIENGEADEAALEAIAVSVEAEIKRVVTAARSAAEADTASLADHVFA